MAYHSAHKGERTKKEKKVYIYGKHALIEALTECPYIVEKVFLAPHVEEEKLFFLLKKNNATVVEMSARDMEDEVGEDTTHQGIIALVNPEKMMRPLDSFLESLDVSSCPALVIFDEVHDPQNVGAVIRSAAAFGVAGILMPEHNQAQVTGAVVKVSAGMAFRIPLVRIGNVNQTVRLLKEKGFWVYGLDMKGAPVHTEKFEKPSVFILGNEAKGIREKTLELCDIPLSIAMHSRTESLNAATAAAIVMHQWSIHHPSALQ